MTVSVTVNQQTVVHKASDGTSLAFPDVCKTPAGCTVVPVPYPNIARSADAADTARTVLADGHPIMIKTSKIAVSTGDEAGSALGIISNTVQGKAIPKSWSMDVEAEGQPVFRRLDLLTHNCNKPQTPITPKKQVNKKARAKHLDPHALRIVKVEWSRDHARCGDPVTLKIQTQNFPDGAALAVDVSYDLKHAGGRGWAPYQNGTTRVHGNKAAYNLGHLELLDWEPGTSLRACVTGLGKTGKALPLRLVGPPPVEEMDRRLTTSKRPLRKKRPLRPWVTINVEPDPNATPIAGLMNYDVTTAHQALEIVCRIALRPQQGVDARRLAARRQAWVQEIETIWNGKFRFHRADCPRGPRCPCRGGCCVFYIIVVPRFVAPNQHPHHTVNVLPGGPADHRPNAENWSLEDNWMEDNHDGHLGQPTSAHEFGHLLGMDDEYIESWTNALLGIGEQGGGATDTRHLNHTQSIMGGGIHVYQHHWTDYPLDKHSLDKWFEKHMTDAYELEPRNGGRVLPN